VEAGVAESLPGHYVLSLGIPLNFYAERMQITCGKPVVSVTCQVFPQTRLSREVVARESVAFIETSKSGVQTLPKFSHHGAEGRRCVC
jgi:hypothetical protein